MVSMNELVPVFHLIVVHVFVRAFLVSQLEVDPNRRQLDFCGNFGHDDVW